MTSYSKACSAVLMAFLFGTMSAFPTDSKTNLITKTSANDAPSLLCNCTEGASRFCGSDGLCDAVEVSNKMRMKLREAKDVMRILWEFPGDKPHQEKRANLCKDVFGAEHLANYTLSDVMFLDFMDWVPSCGRIYTEKQEEIHVCTMAPDNMPQHIPFPKELIDRKLTKLFAFLDCGKVMPDFEVPKFLGSSMGYCSEASLCNTADLTPPEEVSAAPEAVASGTKFNSTELEAALGQAEKVVEISDIEDSESFDQTMLLYVLLPIVGVLILALLLLFIAYKLSLWTYVYNVSGKEKAMSASPPEENSGYSTTV